MADVDPVVLVMPTIADGTVVRWYRDLLAARNSRPMATASRNGVVTEFAPREIALAAYDVAELLAGDRGADVSRLATHERGGFRSGDLVPVAPRPCCDLHSATCELPSELCCDECSEAFHPAHSPGVRCVLAPAAEPEPPKFRITIADRFGGAPR